MGVKIHVPEDKVWEFFENNQDRLSKEMVLVAENTDTEYAVYLTEESFLPVLAAAKGNGEIEYKEPCVTENDCAAVAKTMYSRYLYPVEVESKKKYLQDDPIDGDDEFDFGDRMDKEDAQYIRDDELSLAMSDFLAVALEEVDSSDVYEKYGASMIEDILGSVLQMLTDVYGLSIYRPMFVVDNDTGLEVYTEFPYDEYEFNADTNNNK